MSTVWSFFNTSTGRVGTIQSWTVPVDGIYRIEGFGAQGGNSIDRNSVFVSGGKGAKMSGEFELISGHVIKILVGQKGLSNPNRARGASGGGGTFVYNETTDTILLVSGGGGGAGDYTLQVNAHANITTNGNAGSYRTSTSGGGAGRTNGSGGGAGTYGGGGAGWLSKGTDANSGLGGIRFLDGGFGGYGRDQNDVDGTSTNGKNGGFGGGGGSYAGAGGGGGYSGGGGGHWSYSGNGGGGGSYNIGTNQINQAQTNDSHGSVTITELSQPSTISLRYKNNGSIKNVSSLYYKKNGLWKSVSSISYKANNEWKS